MAGHPDTFDEEEEEDEDEEEENQPWDERLMVDVTVECGGIHCCELSTEIRVDFRNKQQAALKLRNVIETMQNAIPTTRMAAADKEYIDMVPELGIDRKTGEVKPLDENISNALRTQVALRKQKDKKDGDDSAGAREPGK